MRGPRGHGGDDWESQSTFSPIDGSKGEFLADTELQKEEEKEVG